MAKKTKKIVKDLFTEEVFVDREEARSIFREKYDLVKANQDFQVVMYYGWGGIGKTSLLHKLEQDTKAENVDVIWEYYDFNEGQDAISVLRKIVRNLKQKYEFRFPIFTYSIYAYLIKCGEDVSAPEVNNVLDQMPYLREAFKLANLIPGVSTFSQPAEWIVEKIAGITEHTKMKSLKNDVEKLNNMSKEKLLKIIPHIFVRELNENLERKNNPVFVLAFDTYERLVNETSEIGTPLENDLWLRDEEEGILGFISNLVCVIAGREELKWRKLDPDWDEETLTCVQIHNLDEENTLKLLDVYDIWESEIRNKILSVTTGIPLYLDVCIDIYRSVKAYGDPVVPELFDNKIEKVAKRLLTYMSDEEKKVLYLLCCLGQWEDEEYYLLNDRLGHDNINNNVYRKVTNLTFVKHTQDGESIQRKMQEIMIQYCDDTSIIKYVNAMYSVMEEESVLSGFFFRYAYQISYICQLKNNETLTNWWVEKIIPTLQLYVDSFYLSYFSSIYEQLSSLTDIYKLKTLFLSYLLKKGSYNDAAKYIDQYIHLDNEEEGYEFSLTASYHSYINGKDKDALSLREKVYQSRQKTLGMKNRLTLQAGLALVASYSRMGKLQQSTELWQECQKYLEKAQNYDSMISVAQNQLGDSYFRLGEFDEAIKVYESVYEERKKWLGEKNNSTMIAYNHIADCLVNLGSYEKALEIYDIVRQVRESEFAKDKEYQYYIDDVAYTSNDHPDTIIVDNNKAVCLMLSGRYEEAYAMLREVVAKRQVTLAKNAPATMGAMENMALAEYFCGNATQAVDDINQVVQSLTESLGEKHYDTIIAKYHKALIEEDVATIDMIICTEQDNLIFHKEYITKMKRREMIGYFSLGRYYE